VVPAEDVQVWVVSAWGMGGRSWGFWAAGAGTVSGRLLVETALVPVPAVQVWCSSEGAGRVAAVPQVGAGAAGVGRWSSSWGVWLEVVSEGRPVVQTPWR
jgi:hypothetical protein